MGKPQSAALSKVPLSFGLVTFPVDLMPAAKSRNAKATGTSFTNVCPTCAEAHPLHQAYMCDADEAHGPFSAGDAAKALKLADGSLQRLTDDQVAALKVAGASGANLRGAEMHAFPADQVERYTVRLGTGYWLRPQEGSEAAYALMMQVIGERTDVAFLTEVTVKQVTKLYRARSERGVIMLYELARPEEVYQPEPVDTPVDERMLQAADALVDALTDTFDPAEYRNRRAERFEALRAELSPEVPTPISSARSVADDLLAVLQASVEAAKQAA